MLRHGQTVANAMGYLSGSLDTPLTSLGQISPIAYEKSPFFRRGGIVIGNRVSCSDHTCY
ncbi:MAG: hypothetical protein ACK5WY_02405 [Holosporaceae bacterium]